MMLGGWLVFLPDTVSKGDDDMTVYCDHEDGYAIRDESECDGECDPTRVDPVIQLDSDRGHYLMADFIIAVNAMLADEVMPKASMSSDLLESAFDARAYHDHSDQGLHLGSECRLCDRVPDDVIRVESILLTLGYVTEWSDGVIVGKLLDDVKG